jgi:hypothetical protein
MNPERGANYSDFPGFPEAPAVGGQSPAIRARSGAGGSNNDTLPSGLNTMVIGNREPDGARAFDGTISSVALWASQAVPTAQLQAITTPSG